MRHLTLPSLRTEQFSESLTCGAATKRLFVSVSGYESRSSFLVSRVLEQERRARDRFPVIGFEDLKDSLSRHTNDEFYNSKDLPVVSCGTSRDTEFLKCVADELQAVLTSGDPADPVEVHTDYSCMPCHWYCQLPELFENALREDDRAFFWYTPGQYSETVYPTAGTSDFKVFSGRASLSAKFRTHLFGLGFDRVRSQAIWSVLDPRTLVCFYGDPAVNAAYVDRVRTDNREVLDAASFTFTVPVTDFAAAFSKIRSAVFQFRELGDVVIVPDGPKPLVFASSLVPMTIDDVSGVVCFHVSKRKMEGFTPVDVPAAGEPVGFSIRSRRHSASTPSRQTNTFLESVS